MYVHVWAKPCTTFISCRYACAAYPRNCRKMERLARKANVGNTCLNAKIHSAFLSVGSMYTFWLSISETLVCNLLFSLFLISEFFNHKTLNDCKTIFYTTRTTSATMIYVDSTRRLERCNMWTSRVCHSIRNLQEFTYWWNWKLTDFLHRIHYKSHPHIETYTQPLTSYKHPLGVQAFCTTNTVNKALDKWIIALLSSNKY